jgi:hypothetical protein
VATASIGVAQAESAESEAYLLTAADYYQMVDAGIIPSGRQVYLWDGRLFEKMARKPRHATAHGKLARALFHGVPAHRWYVSSENPVEVADDKVPLPDLAVVRGHPDRSPKRPPVAADVELIVEIRDTSISRDLGANLLAYASAMIPRYWVVNLRSGRVEVYADPVGETGVREGRCPYRGSEQYGPGESVELALEGCVTIVIPVDQFLGRE